MKNAKEELLKVVGDISGVEVFNTQVLVAVYIRPEKTSGGIIRPDTMLKEDQYQSKVGLVLKKGKAAFEDTEGRWFKDVVISEGDWVVFRPSDGWGLLANGPNGQMCRMLSDTNVLGRVDHPERIY